MELLILVLLAAAVWLVWRKPEKEKVAFRLFVLGAALCFAMYFIASFTSVLPFGSY